MKRFKTHLFKKLNQNHYNLDLFDNQRSLDQAKECHHISNHAHVVSNYLPIKHMHPPHISTQSSLPLYLNFQA